MTAAESRDQHLSALLELGDLVLGCTRVEQEANHRTPTEAFRRFAELDDVTIDRLLKELVEDA